MNERTIPRAERHVIAICSFFPRAACRIDGLRCGNSLLGLQAHQVSQGSISHESTGPQPPRTARHSQRPAPKRAAILATRRFSRHTGLYKELRVTQKESVALRGQILWPPCLPVHLTEPAESYDVPPTRFDRSSDFEKAARRAAGKRARAIG